MTTAGLNFRREARCRDRVLLLAIALLCVARALLPGDINWVNDEPNLIAKALHANSAHTLASNGMVGTFDRPSNGPIPVWIYQAALLFTHDLRVIVIFRGILTSACIAMALLMIADAAKLWKPFAAIALLSPYLWIYARGIWDCTFNIPLAAMAFALFAQALGFPTRLRFCLLSLLLCIAPFIHPMAIPFVAPFVIYILLVRRALVMQWRFSLIAVVVLVIASMWRFLSVFFHSPGVPFWRFSWSAAVHIIGGPQYLTGLGLYELFNQQWTWGQSARVGEFFDALTAPTGLAYFFALLGLSISIRRLLRRARDVRDHLAMLGILIILSQLLMFIITNTGEFAYYWNTTWIVYAYFAWIGITSTIRQAWGKALVAVYAICLGGTLVFVAYRIHKTAGTRDTAFGTTLGEQIQAVNTIVSFSPHSRLIRQPIQFWRYPQSLDVLIELHRPANSVGLPKAELDLRYATHDSWDAHLDVKPR